MTWVAVVTGMSAKHRRVSVTTDNKMRSSRGGQVTTSSYSPTICVADLYVKSAIFRAPDRFSVVP